MSIRKMADNIKRPYLVTGSCTVIPKDLAGPGKLIMVEDGYQNLRVVRLSKKDLLDRKTVVQPTR